MDRKIQIVHLPEGHNVDRALLTNEIEKFYDKMNQRLPGEMFVEVHFKEFHKQGTKEQVECKARVRVAGIKLNSTGLEWDAMKSLKHALSSLEREGEKAIYKHKGK